MNKQTAEVYTSLLLHSSSTHHSRQPCANLQKCARNRISRWRKFTKLVWVSLNLKYVGSVMPGTIRSKWSLHVAYRTRRKKVTIWSWPVYLHDSYIVNCMYYLNVHVWHNCMCTITSPGQNWFGFRVPCRLLTHQADPESGSNTGLQNRTLRQFEAFPGYFSTDSVSAWPRNGPGPTEPSKRWHRRSMQLLSTITILII